MQQGDAIGGTGEGRRGRAETDRKAAAVAVVVAAAAATVAAAATQLLAGAVITGAITGVMAQVTALGHLVSEQTGGAVRGSVAIGVGRLEGGWKAAATGMPAGTMSDVMVTGTIETGTGTGRVGGAKRVISA